MPTVTHGCHTWARKPCRGVSIFGRGAEDTTCGGACRLTWFRSLVRPSSLEACTPLTMARRESELTWRLRRCGSPSTRPRLLSRSQRTPPRTSWKGFPSLRSTDSSGTGLTEANGTCWRTGHFVQLVATRRARIWRRCVMRRWPALRIGCVASSFPTGHLTRSRHGPKRMNS